MIYEMVVGCVNELRAGWTALKTALEQLRDTPLLDNNPITAINTLLPVLVDPASILDPDETGTGFANIQTLLRQPRNTLNGSRTRLTGKVDPQLFVLLPGLLISPIQDIQDNATAVQERQEALRQLIDDCLREIEELTTREGARASIGGINNSVENISAYPVLTQEAGYGSASTYPGGAAGTKPIGQVVDGALRDVLGWRPKLSDHKGFVAALTQSFSCKEIEGRTECVYTPRTYAIQVQADLGAITGAQASIYARARAALDQSLIILDRLYALDPAADPQNVEANRAIVRSEFTELVNELGIEGRPRVHRVDSLFDQLCGAGNPSFDPERIQKQLLQLRDVFGLTRNRVNTVDEEHNLTDFLTLVDYVNSLKQSWLTQHRFFDRSSTAEPFLGTQLVLVSRALAVVAESVREVYFAMDSVFLGPGERQTIELLFNNRPPIFVSELLGWVDRFASEEAPLLIQDAGKAGVRSFFPTIDLITALVRDSQIPPQNLNRLPAAYRTARVQRTLQELAVHLGETADLAREFVIPQVSSNIPFARRTP